MQKKKCLQKLKSKKNLCVLDIVYFNLFFNFVFAKGDAKLKKKKRIKREPLLPCSYFGKNKKKMKTYCKENFRSLILVFKTN